MMVVGRVMLQIIAEKVRVSVTGDAHPSSGGWVGNLYEERIWDESGQIKSGGFLPRYLVRAPESAPDQIWRVSRTNPNRP